MHDDEMVVYDVEEAAAHVAGRTGHDLMLVEEVLEAEFLFNAALGFYEIPDDEEGREFMEEVMRLRKEHADLIPPAEEPLEDFEEIEERLVAFITRMVSGIEPQVVEAILDEHILYLEEKGILEPAEE